MRTAFGETFQVPDGYLNTASIGIPPSRVVDAVTAMIRDWTTGAAHPADYDEPVAQARQACRQDKNRIVGGILISDVELAANGERGKRIGFLSRPVIRQYPQNAIIDGRVRWVDCRRVRRSRSRSLLRPQRWTHRGASTECQ